jgi:hypothetical protein
MQWKFLKEPTTLPACGDPGHQSGVPRHEPPDRLLGDPKRLGEGRVRWGFPVIDDRHVGAAEPDLGRAEALGGPEHTVSF